MERFTTLKGCPGNLRCMRSLVWNSFISLLARVSAARFVYILIYGFSV